MAKISAPPGFEIPCIRSSAFADRAKDGVAHAFFGRRGGVSKGLYAGLNCGVGSSDDAKDVGKNRSLVAGALGTEPDKLLSLYQIHSSECVNVNEPWEMKDRPQADGMVTDVPGLVLSILTADCAPVLFLGWAGNKPVIGAAHAGWKGALAGVLERTVDKMIIDYGAESDTIRAMIGPSIQKKSYEVDENFFDAFMDENEEYERFFLGEHKPGHYMFDLPGFCALRLYERGVQKVLIENADTCSNEADYFSYRRTTHRKEKDYGRQISAIMISP